MSRYRDAVGRSLGAWGAVVVALLAAWGGCGTVVRNPGDDVDKPPRHKGEPPRTPEPENSRDEGARSAKAEVPSCRMEIAKGAGTAGSVVVSFVVLGGEPVVNVTEAYSFDVVDGGGRALGTVPLTLSSGTAVSFVAGKSGRKACFGRFDVAEADLATGGSWVVTIMEK